MALTFENPKEYIAELIGTAILVTIGCMIAAAGMLAAAIAFTLAYIGLIYCIGKYCGCHFNPVITLSMFVTGKMKANDTLWYVLAQIIGGIIGGIITIIIAAQVWHTGDVIIYASYFGDAFSNYSRHIDTFGAIIVEFMLAFILAYVAMKATDSKKIDMKSGAIVAVALFGVVYIAAAMTDSAANPAKSIGTAFAMLFSGIDGKFDPLIQLWLFIIFPALGALVGAFVYMMMESGEFDLNKYLSAIKKKKSEGDEADVSDDAEYSEEEAAAEEPVEEEPIVDEPAEEIPEIESVEEEPLPEVESEEEAEEIVVEESETKTE